MIKCPRYGTVAGCGKCSVNIQQDDDLGMLSELSTSMIGLAILELPHVTNSTIDLSSVSIKCNGIIRLKKDVNRQTTDYESAFAFNKQFYVSLLDRRSYVDNYNDTIASYLDTVRNTTNIQSLRKAAGELVAVLQPHELSTLDRTCSY